MAFLGIAADASRDEMRQFLASTGTDGFTQVLDPDGSLWVRFGADIRSSFLFVGDDGTVRRTGYGEMDRDRLEDEVEALIST